jgi:hypothetical protein
MGWGGTLGQTQGWGLMPFGGGGDVLQLVRAEAIRENLVRFFFSASVKFTKILDAGDGSDASKYSVDAVTTSIGSDGLPAREVDVARVELFDASTVDVWLDRSMSPYPSLYTASAHDLVVAVTNDPLDVAAAIVEFYGLQQGANGNLPGAVAPRRDFATPDDLQSYVDAELSSKSLGVFAPDESGDYASDTGETSYRTRVFRRGLTKKDGFAHLLGYGCGLLELVKQLGRARTQATMAAEIESQVRQEPETVECKASFQQDRHDPSLWWLKLQAKANTGESLDELIPLRG